MTETRRDLADPAAYLAAALDAAEATANAAADGWGYLWYTDLGNVLSPAKATHVADNSPEHVLRLVAAHRKLLAMHVPGGDKGDDCLGCCEGMNRYEELIYDWWPCPTIKLLAEAYGWTA